MPLTVGPFTVTPYAVNHPVEAYGYRVEADGAVLAFTGDTDDCDNLTPLLRGADLALLDSAFVDGRDTVAGIHLSGSRAARGRGAGRGVRRLVLTHLPAWNDPEVCRAQAAAVWPGEVELARRRRGLRALTRARSRRAPTTAAEPCAPCLDQHHARHDGRAPDQLREVRITRNWLDHAEGSVLVEFGRTRVLCAASFTEGVPRWLKGRGHGLGDRRVRDAARARRTPAATASRVAGRIGGRTHEISRLVGRSLRAVIDTKALGENTIVLDCDVLQADGGTRTAAITGAWVALADAVADARAQGSASPPAPSRSPGRSPR